MVSVSAKKVKKKILACVPLTKVVELVPAGFSVHGPSHKRVPRYSVFGSEPTSKQTPPSLDPKR